ncbi:MAG: TIGR04053 family radical SAM/SPASM domain-containing protein [Gemmatimonadota bacterium]
MSETSVVGPAAARRAHGRAPRVVTWEMTQACDLNCLHCRAEACPGRHPLELTTEEGKALIDRVLAFGDPPPILVFSGGDPLKRPDLMELARYATGRGLRVGVTPAPTALLNGSALRELRDAKVHRLALSLDGATRERHDAFRGEPGSFAAIERAARLATELRLPLQINTTVARSTVADLPAIADRVEEMGAVMWEVFFLVPIGRGIALEPLDASRTEEVLRWLYRRQRDAPFRLITVEAPAYRRVGRQIEAAERGKRERTSRRGVPEATNGGGIGSGNGVPAGRPAPEGSTGDANGFVFISHLGEVYPSGFLPLAAGNVRTDDLVALYRHSPVFRRLRDPSTLKGKCGRCDYRHICGGSRARAFALTGDALESDPFCPYEPERSESEARRSPSL